MSRLTDEQILAARDYGRKIGDYTEEVLATEVLESRAEIARLTKERDEAQAEYRRYGELRELLSNPNAVYVNMLRGEIAKPSWEQMKHLRPQESAEDRDEDAIIQESRSIARMCLDEDNLTEIITDSIDMDWTPRDAAKAIVRAMKGGNT